MVRGLWLPLALPLFDSPPLPPPLLYPLDSLGVFQNFEEEEEPKRKGGRG